jgi:hypothetical protein
MRINYVSVKGYERTHGGTKLCLRAELDGEPPRLWSRLFRRTWLSREPGGSLAQIRFSGNDILLYIPDAEILTVTIDALKSTLVEVEDKLRRNDVELDILGIP